MTDFDILQINNAQKIYEASIKKDLVVFIGAGVSANSGVPDWELLITALKRKLPNSIQEENDYLKISQLYKETNLPEDYLNGIRTILKDGETHPNPIHDEILQLSPLHIITTNYDDLIEQAANKAKKYYSVIRCDLDVPNARSSRFLIKMHGDFISKKIVLTESDYYNYTTDYPLIDSLVKTLFASKTILCVGFSFNDLNLKFILNRIKYMLGKDARPIYLLANYDENSVLYKYLKGKGIQPFWLPAETINKYGKKAPESLTNSMGQEIFRQLSCLQYDVSKPLDMIEALYSYAKMIEDQMPFFFLSRLGKILPKQIYEWDHTYSMGIQLDSEYIKKLVQQFRTLDGRKKILAEKGEKIHSLIQTAANNCINEFDGIKLYKFNAFRRYCNRREKDCSSFFLDFDFISLTERVKMLEQRDTTYTFHDLELPFIKWMLGDISCSYEIYESLEQKYWMSNKPILYFLCSFNKKALLNSPVPFNDYERIRHLFDEAERIDLNEILSKLSIDSTVKGNLYDLINNQYYIDILSSINHLTNEILKDRYRSEHHGVSNNNHIPELYSKLARYFNHSHVNHLITMTSRSVYEAYRNGIIGLLNAHKIIENTSSNKYFPQSRLERIALDHVKLMIFTIHAKDLKNAFEIYSIDSLIFDSMAVSYIQGVIDNILRDQQLIMDFLRKDILENLLANLLILYSKSGLQINKTEEIVDIFISYGLSDDSINFDFQTIVYDIISKSNFSLSERQCRELISVFPERCRVPFIPNLLYYASSIMKNNGWMLDRDFKSMKNSPLSSQSLKEMYLYYDIVSDDTRESISEILEDAVTSSSGNVAEICSFITDKGVYSIVTQNFVKRIEQLKNKSSYNLIRCRTLKSILLNSKDDAIKKDIIDMSKEDLLLDFYLNPLSFKGAIDPQWLEYIDDSTFKELIKKNDIIQLIKKQGSSPYLRDRFWRMI